MSFSSIKSQFETNHNVYLQDTWLQPRLLYPENTNLDNKRLYQAIYNDFLDSDLNKSMKPRLPPLIEDMHQITIGEHQPIILQIADIFEVGVSAQSLLDVVNSYLSGSVKQGHKYNDISDKQYKTIQFPRGMLKFQLTDGYQSVVAIEYKPLSNLNLLTPIGIKISVSKALVLRGVLLLGPENITILGGFADEHRSIDAIRVRLLKQLDLPIPDCSQEIQPNQEPKSTSEGQKTQSNTNSTDLAPNFFFNCDDDDDDLYVQSDLPIPDCSQEIQPNQEPKSTSEDQKTQPNINSTDLASDSFFNCDDDDDDLCVQLDFPIPDCSQEIQPNQELNSTSKDQKTQSNVNSTNLASDCFINCDYDDDLYIMEISPTEKACLSMLSQDTDELPSEDEAIATFSNKNDY